MTPQEAFEAWWKEYDHGGALYPASTGYSAWLAACAWQRKRDETIEEGRMDAEAVARQTVEQLCKEVIGVHPEATGRKLLPIVQDALTTFAAQQVQATWKEAIKEVEMVELIHAENESTVPIQSTQCTLTFRREAGFICAKNSCLANLRRRAYQCCRAQYL